MRQTDGLTFSSATTSKCLGGPLNSRPAQPTDLLSCFFACLARYHFVGKVVHDPVADMIQRKLLEERVAKRVSDEILGADGPALSPVSVRRRCASIYLTSSGFKTTTPEAQHT